VDKLDELGSRKTFVFFAFPTRSFVVTEGVAVGRGRDKRHMDVPRGESGHDGPTEPKAISSDRHARAHTTITVARTVEPSNRRTVEPPNRR
jgi:hypothetical protein